MTSWDFDVETAVTLEEQTTADGSQISSWSTTVTPQWNIGDVPNGGYLVSSVLRAMGHHSDHPDPVTVTTHFLRPGLPGQDGVVHTRTIRTGRGYTTVDGQLDQDGKTRIMVRATFGTLAAHDATDSVSAVNPLGQLTLTAPDVPKPQDCPARDGAAQGVSLPILDRVDTRIASESVPDANGDPLALVQAWGRFSDGRPPDVLSLPLFADAFPPPIFSRLGLIGWVPTLELTVHLRKRPAPGWLLGQFSCSDQFDGRMIEDGLLWDGSGNLVAQSRQVALLRLAPDSAG